MPVASASLARPAAGPAVSSSFSTVPTPAAASFAPLTGPMPSISEIFMRGSSR
jgi:hypothetical protein